jgi:hypothetical protein
LAHAGHHPLHLSQEFNPRPPRPISRSLHRRNTQPVRRKRAREREREREKKNVILPIVVLPNPAPLPSSFHPIFWIEFHCDHGLSSWLRYRLEVFPGHLL